MEKSFLKTLRSSISYLSLLKTYLPKHTGIEEKTKEVSDVTFVITFTEWWWKNLILFHSFHWAKQRRRTYYLSIDAMTTTVPKQCFRFPERDQYYSVIRIPILFGFFLPATMAETGMEAKFLYFQPSVLAALHVGNENKKKNVVLKSLVPSDMEKSL